MCGQCQLLSRPVAQWLYPALDETGSVDMNCSRDISMMLVKTQYKYEMLTSPSRAVGCLGQMLNMFFP